MGACDVNLMELKGVLHEIVITTVTICFVDPRMEANIVVQAKMSTKNVDGLNTQLSQLDGSSSSS